MDLRGTDFMVSPGILWTSVGNKAVHRVDISAVKLITIIFSISHAQLALLCFLFSRVLEIGHFDTCFYSFLDILHLFVMYCGFFSMKISLCSVDTTASL